MGGGAKIVGVVGSSIFGISGYKKLTNYSTFIKLVFAHIHCQECRVENENDGGHLLGC